MRFAVIGAGSLGIALASQLVKRGHDCFLGTRNPTSTKSQLDKLFADKTQIPEVKIPIDAVQDADIVILTVADDVIQSVCDKLAAHISADCCVVHCAGALDSDILASAKTHGCATASLHPLNTFPSPAAALKVLTQANHQTALVYEGDELIEDRLIPVFSSLGFKPIKIEKAAKPLYHAACVVACNLLTALMDVSLQTAQLAKLDREDFWQAIQPLLQSTLDNINEQGCAEALSGPVARGDVATVSKQLAELDRASAPIAATYRNLSSHALDLASPKLANSPALLRELKRILKPLD